MLVLYWRSREDLRDLERHEFVVSGEGRVLTLEEEEGWCPTPEERKRKSLRLFLILYIRTDRGLKEIISFVLSLGGGAPRRLGGKDGI